MTSLNYVNGVAHLENVSLADIAAEVGTPVYVYSADYVRSQLSALKEAFAGTTTEIHYSVKANSNVHLLRLIAAQDVGFDIVSGGELSRVLAAEGDPARVIFSGVGKTAEEMDFALKVGIATFNVESASELKLLSERARIQNTVANISVRVNPNVDARTHPYISTGLKDNKFGVPPEVAMQMYRDADADPYLNITGIDCHIGSQITEHEPLLDSMSFLLTMVDDLAADGIVVQHIDLGGGMGITYRDEQALDTQTYGAMVQQMLGARELTIALEPGRSIVANAGVLLCRTQYLKTATMEGAPNFAIVDAAMNDLIRPALYEAWHGVLPVEESAEEGGQTWNVVGPICESGDFLAKDRQLNLTEGSLLAILSAGAYGMVQASNYNSRGRAAEVLVDGESYRIIRRREHITDQLRLELEL